MDLQEEVRDEFLIDKKRKGIWHSQMEMLVKLLDVCKRHDIQIFAVAGTMLGAIRHKGYIPWDDDVDMAMTREGFNKLLEIGASEFEYPIFLQTVYTEDDYYSPLIRLRDSRTTGIVRSGTHDDWNKNCNNGIYIDIFPLDGLTDNLRLRKKQFWQIRFLNMLMRESVYVEKGKKNAKIRHAILKSVVTPNLRKKIYKRYNKICSRYSYKTEKVALLAGSVYNKAYYWNYEDIKDVVWVPFEDIQIPIPKGYENCLRVQYGNYMELPPVEKRGAHHEETVVFDPFVDYKTYIATHEFN